MADQTVDVLKLFQQAALEVNNKKLDNLSRSTVISFGAYSSAKVGGLDCRFMSDSPLSPDLRRQHA